ncbi:hypothetical protein, partial [Cronobacter dublinensis]|uniref:hypothetical protein n=1 Tax=Cronobacter dublinensis TaxID=413497 RepID=UPI00131A2276
LIFNKKNPLSLYLNAYLILKRCTELLKQYEFKSKRDFNNVIYHTAMAVVLKLAIIDGKQSEMPKFVGSFDNNRITEKYFDEIFELVWAEYKKLGGDDTTAKGNDFVNNISQTLAISPKLEQSPMNL